MLRRFFNNIEKGTLYITPSSFHNKTGSVILFSDLLIIGNRKEGD